MSTTEPLYTGYLRKSGAYNTNLKRRYFALVIEKDKPVLYYYHPSSITRPISEIQLCDCVVKICAGEEKMSQIISSENYAFCIINSTRIYYLAANSEIEMLEWISVLAECCSEIIGENQLISGVEDDIHAYCTRKKIQKENLLLDL